jgi:hypothetical protein
MLRRERPAGSRRDHYVVEADTWYELILRREQLLDRWIAQARTGVDALGADTPAGARVAESAAFFEFLREEMPALIERWKERRASLR